MDTFTRLPALIACLLTITVTAAAGAPATERLPASVVMHHAPLYVAGGTAQAPGRLSLNVYGKVMELELDPNTALNRLRTKTDYRLLRGRIAGVDSSWLRLMQRGNALSGVVFDGETLWGIEPRAAAAHRLQHPDTDATTENVVFRMDDLLMPAGVAGCDALTDGLPVSGATALKSLGSELQATAQAATDGRRQMVLQVVADYEFFRLFGAATESEILSRLNTVDGFYVNQLNTNIDIGLLEIFTEPDDPFTDDAPDGLLQELRLFRVAGGYERGPTKLLTGRDLAGNARGIAYLGAACDAQFGASLSQQTADPWISVLTIAHEIGHTLGAWHDGETSTDPDRPNPCEFAPSGFLMDAEIKGSERFSQCSLTTIERWLAAATPSSACITGATASVEPQQAAEASADGGGGSVALHGLLALLLLARRSNVCRCSKS